MVIPAIPAVACALAVALAAASAYAVPPVYDADSMSCLLKPRRVVQLGSPVFGVLAELTVDRGDKVARGQLVAKLDGSVEETQVALDRFRAANTTAIESAQTDLAWNQRELNRRHQLAGNMFSKANEVDEMETRIEQDRTAVRKAEADQKTAALELTRSEAQLHLKLISSPVNGVVTEIKLSPGEYIYETTPIMTIAEIDPLNVDLVLPSEKYRAVHVGMVARLRLEVPVDATLDAVVDAVDPVIDAASDTFRTRLVLANPGNHIPAGVHCSVSFSSAPAPGQ
jgi:RND family efflux transporter MFP subunit